LYVSTITFTFSMVFWKDWYASSGGCCSSSMQRSSLLRMSTGMMRSPMAWRSTVSVCTATPSTQSTTTSAPSVTRSAAVTSDEKSTCPGESIRLMRKDFSDTSMPVSAASAFASSCASFCASSCFFSFSAAAACASASSAASAASAFISVG